MTPDCRTIDTANWITLRWTRGTRYFRVHLEQDMARLAACDVQSRRNVCSEQRRLCRNLHFVEREKNRAGAARCAAF